MFRRPFRAAHPFDDVLEVDARPCRAEQETRASVLLCMTVAATRAVLEALLGFVAALLSITRTRGGGEKTTTPVERPSGGWSDAGLPEGSMSRRCLFSDDSVDDVTRTDVASAWNDCALAAHSALARSSQRALDLVSLGAPAHLVACAHEDVLDEVRRVKVYFSVARGIDGRSALVTGETPRRSLPRARPAALALLATEAVLDIALFAGRASRMNAKLARRTTDRIVRRALEELSANEGRRVPHAWAIVRWCLEEERRAVERALRTLVGRLPAPQRNLPADAIDGGWERWGIAGAALEGQEHARSCELVERTVHELVSTTPTGRRLAVA